MAAWKSPGKKKRVAAPAPARRPMLAQLGTAPTAEEVPTLVLARDTALNALGANLEPAHMVQAARRSWELADKVRLSVMQANETPACRKGCSWCCHLKVGVTLPELIAIVQHLEASPQHLAIVRKKAAQLAQDPRILSDVEKPRARIPCALLDADGSCGVYEVRPIPCRGWLSTDEDSCKKHLDQQAEPKFVLSVARSSRHVQLGLAKAMDDVKRYPYLVELTSGLDIALNVPNSIESWLAGEPVFERASAAQAQ